MDPMRRMLRSLFATATLLLGAGVGAQQLAGFTFVDALVSAVHPNGCSSQYVLGFPDHNTWVNMVNGSVMTGLFNSTWADSLGNDLVLETSFHADNYLVRLILEGGTFSAQHTVNAADWTRIDDVVWTYIFTDCSIGKGLSERHILPLDFATHFGVLPTQRVAGVEITFLNTWGLPDLAGVYIIGAEPCDTTLSLGPDTLLCPGEQVVLDATTAFATYLWQDNSTAPQFTVTNAGVYEVRVFTPCGIIADTIVVDYAEGLVVDLGPDGVHCAGEELLLDATVADGTYLWQDGSTNNTYPVNAPGLYSVSVTTSCGVLTDSIHVDFVATTALELGNDITACIGDAVLLDATSPGATYLWQDGSTASTYWVDATGLYRVQVEGPCGPVTDSVLVSFAPRPALQLGNDSTLCEGDALLLDVTIDMATYRWQDGSTAPTYLVEQAGTYSVALTLNGCTVRDTLLLTNDPLPHVDLGPDRSICSAPVIVLDATSPTADTYLWHDGDTAPTWSVPAPGTYWVVVTNHCGASSDTINITVNPLRHFDLPDEVLCDGDELLVDPSLPGASYLWLDGSTSSTYLISAAGDFGVSITLGICSAMDTFTVTEEDCGVLLQMPNVFTPNNDGHNDRFLPIEMLGITSATLVVHNRWGQVVHDAPLLLRSGWNGSDAPDGTYFWTVGYTDRLGVMHSDAGVVSLLR